jgi:uncharacterized protein (TIGR02284 family)
MGNVEKKEEIIGKLSNVVQLDFDAIAAYKAAIERLDKSDYKTIMRKFLADHERHVENLSEVIRRKGGEPPTSGDIKQILTKGQVIIGGLAGDQAILKAMKLNEDQTNNMYGDMVKEQFPEDVHQLLLDGLADERRHREWLTNTIERNS